MIPVVSVLVPIYNASAFLSQCLDSIVSQTFENLQIVLIDDGSTDNSLFICNQYAENDKRIEVFHKENSGVASTRNDLLAHVRGDFFLFVDSDDWMEKNMIEVLLSMHPYSHADIMCCGVTSIDSIIESKLDFQTVELWKKENAVERYLFHKEFRGTLWNKLFSSKLLDSEHFNPEISYGEDALFCWHLLNRATNIAVSTFPLYHYRMNACSISHESFGTKKLSAHYVWEQICEETACLYPQFLSIAKARHCIEDTILLRDAAHCGYGDKAHINLLQSTIRRNWSYLNEVDITSFKMKIYSFLSSYSFMIAAHF